MNDVIAKNIAYCFAGGEDTDFLNSMIEFAKIMKDIEVEKLIYFNDYLESAIACMSNEPGLKHIIRFNISTIIQKPHFLMDLVANSTEGISDAEGIIKGIQTKMMEKGYYEERVFYTCPHCKATHPIGRINSGICIDCGKEIERSTYNIGRARIFADYFSEIGKESSKNSTPKERKTYKEAPSQPAADKIEDSPGTAYQASAELSEDDIANHPFFHKRHKSGISS